jgi:hypothetical protein
LDQRLSIKVHWSSEGQPEARSVALDVVKLDSLANTPSLVRQTAVTILDPAVTGGQRPWLALYMRGIETTFSLRSLVIPDTTFLQSFALARKADEPDPKDSASKSRATA